MAILNVNHLSKYYGSFKALDNFSLSLEQGQAYGILGPNGSGKTTALSIILGLRHADEGEVTWFNGRSDDAVRRLTGSSLENPAFLSGLSGAQNLKISADIKGAPYSEIERVLNKTGLWSYRNRKFHKYSMGMKQRLSIAAALLGDPEVLILDEPTNGLDPQGIYQIRELILEFTSEGKTLLMASHILSEVEKICNHTLILNHGKIIHDGPTDRVLVQKPTLEIASKNLQDLHEALSSHTQIENLNRTNGELLTATIDDDFDIAELNEYLVKSGISPYHIVKKHPTLEQQFIELIKEN